MFTSYFSRQNHNFCSLFLLKVFFFFLEYTSRYGRPQSNERKATEYQFRFYGVLFFLLICNKTSQCTMQTQLRSSLSSPPTLFYWDLSLLPNALNSVIKHQVTWHCVGGAAQKPKHRLIPVSIYIHQVAQHNNGMSFRE